MRVKKKNTVLAKVLKPLLFASYYIFRASTIPNALKLWNKLLKQTNLLNK